MLDIQPSQILYLEYGDARLYIEVIQTVSRNRLWARPLMLVQGLPRDPYHRQQAITTAAVDLDNCALTLLDLKSSPDLVWPRDAFHIAFDTDFFSLLFHLKISERPIDSEEVRQQFKQFVQGCWQKYTASGDPTRVLS
ncbi:MAG: hypothetical protein AAGF01_00555 [Cyanobacteria bacterium P01_G01_bin.38]